MGRRLSCPPHSGCLKPSTTLRFLLFDRLDHLSQLSHKSLRLTEGTLRQLKFTDEHTVFIHQYETIPLVHETPFFCTVSGQTNFWPRATDLGLGQNGKRMPRWTSFGMRCGPIRLLNPAVVELESDEADGTAWSMRSRSVT